MQPVNNKVLLSCDQSQKDSVTLEGNEFSLTHIYEVDYKIKSPTIATVIEGNDLLRKGDILVCHHNLFYLPSPYHLYGDLFSVPFSKVLFAKILEDGSLMPICGNILGDRIPIESEFELPPDEVRFYNDRLLVTNAGYTKWKAGQILFTRPSACYDINYHWNKERKTVTKISEDQVCAILK